MNEDQKDRFKSQSSIRYFVLMNHELLAREIAEGSGDSLAELQAALEAYHGRAWALSELRLIVNSVPTAVAFAERLLQAS